MMKTRVNNFYSKLIAESNDSEHGSYLVWNDTHFFPTIYFYDPRKNTRKYCIKWDENKICRISKLPKWDGLDIKITEINIYSEVKGTYLVFEQMLDQDAEIFELMVSDLEEKTRDINSLLNLKNTILNILEKWRRFFQVSSNGKLDPGKQQGLYAELVFLKTLIQIVGVQAVYVWTGPEAESRDFYLNGDGFEIKSSSKKGSTVSISSELQLDERDIKGNLYLIYYSLRRSKVDGESLPILVSSIQELLCQDTVTLDEFYTKLFSAGYLKDHGDLYTCKFTVQERLNYHVHGDFPRITRDTATHGISNISYNLNLDSCKNYLISNEELNTVLLPGNEINAK